MRRRPPWWCMRASSAQWRDHLVQLNQVAASNAGTPHFPQLGDSDGVGGWTTQDPGRRDHLQEGRDTPTRLSLAALTRAALSTAPTYSADSLVARRALRRSLWVLERRRRLRPLSLWRKSSCSSPSRSTARAQPSSSAGGWAGGSVRHGTVWGEPSAGEWERSTRRVGRRRSASRASECGRAAVAAWP